MSNCLGEEEKKKKKSKPKPTCVIKVLPFVFRWISVRFLGPPLDTGFCMCWENCQTTCHPSKLELTMMAKEASETVPLYKGYWHWLPPCHFLLTHQKLQRQRGYRWNCENFTKWKQRLDSAQISQIRTGVQREISSSRNKPPMQTIWRKATRQTQWWFHSCQYNKLRSLPRRQMLLKNIFHCLAYGSAIAAQTKR